jgi:hypothetical protein
MKERKILALLFLVIFTWVIPICVHSMTFQFDQSKPGVTEFVQSYVRFSIQGVKLTEILPPLFYLVTESSERETVVIAKVGKISKNSALRSTLSAMVGQTPKSVQGPHGKTIFYNEAPNMKMSAYTEWQEWLFIAGNPDVLANFLKGAPSPQALVTPDKAFLSDGLAKSAAVRFWANNAKGDFTALVRENQPRSMIPLPKNPDSVKRFSGVFRLGPGHKVVATATAVPSEPKLRAALKKELELTLDSSRRLLDIFRVPSSGSVKEAGNILNLRLSIDDYLLGQPGLFNPRPNSTLPASL